MSYHLMNKVCHKKQMNKCIAENTGFRQDSNLELLDKKPYHNHWAKENSLFFQVLYLNQDEAMHEGVLSHKIR